MLGGEFVQEDDAFVEGDNNTYDKTTVILEIL